MSQLCEVMLVTPSLRAEILCKIQSTLDRRSTSLREAIKERELYFRISVVGTCNLACPFCHNEGAPTKGKMSIATAEQAIAAATRIGFTRVQFTGGEPLLRPDIAEFVRVAKRYVLDVGVTTNGTFLPRRLDALVDAGLHRLHVSLQSESLRAAGKGGEWGIPSWLHPTVEKSQASGLGVRFNLPVPAGSFPQAERFLHLLTSHRIDVKVFSVLPEGLAREETYPLELLEDLVDRVNAHNRGVAQERGVVLIRGYRPPSGIRCTTCADKDNCKEQSHSLRLGADLRLRPCLATRAWDSDLPVDGIDAAVREAAMFSLDYRW
jgi:GTP 3',8-cyclase